ncbi:MAG: DUF5683 domain-containing protein [Mangrovibacterium sp.]|jgi:hypothetical protein
MTRQDQNIRALVDWKVSILAILMLVTGLYASGQEHAGKDTTTTKVVATDTVKVDTTAVRKVDTTAVKKVDTTTVKVVTADTLAVKKQALEPVEKKEERVHSPKKATIYSAVFPGLGQIYNRKYWKLPLVYIGFASLIYAIDWNNDYYVLYKQAYIDISDNDPTSNSFKDLDIEGHWDFNNQAQVEQFKTRLERAKESTRRYRDLCIIGTAAFYAINIIDASVDAHFFNFDISDDLTMNWMPQPIYAMDQTLMGIRFVINF